MSTTFRALVAVACLPLFAGCAAETSDMDTGPTSLEDGIDLAWTGTAPGGPYLASFNSLNRSGCTVTAMKSWFRTSSPVGGREENVAMFLKVDQDPMSPAPCAAGRVPAYQLVTNGLFFSAPLGSNTGRMIAAPGANVVYVSNLVTSWSGPPNPVTGKLVRASMRSLATGNAVGSIADIRCTNGVVTVSSQTLDLATGTLTLVGSKNCLTVGIGETPSTNPMWRATYVGFGTNPTMNALPTTFQTF